MKYKTNPVSMIFKILVLLLLLLFNYEIFRFTLSFTTDSILTDDSSYDWVYLHERAAEESYGDLLYSLNLRDLYGEEYKDLWNVTEAYRLYCLYLTASRAALETDDPDFARLCQAQADQALTDLMEIPEDTSDATANAVILRIKGRVTR